MKNKEDKSKSAFRNRATITDEFRALMANIDELYAQIQEHFDAIDASVSEIVKQIEAYYENTDQLMNKQISTPPLTYFKNCVPFVTNYIYV